MSIFIFSIYFMSVIAMIIIATITALSSYGIKKYFFVATIYLAAIWLFLQYIVQAFSLSGEPGLRVIQFASALSIIMATSFYAFLRSYTDKHTTHFQYLVLVLVSFVGFMLNISGFMITKAHGDHIGVVVSEATPLYSIYVNLIGVIFLAALYQLFKFTMTTKQKKSRMKNKLMLIGVLQAIVIVVFSNIFMQSSAEFQVVMPVSLLIMTMFMGLAIIKYQFFDIKAAVLRTLTYALSLITLSGIYYGFAYLLSVFIFKDNINTTSLSVSPMNVALALVLAFIFQPIRKFFDKITNKFFYKDSYNTDDFFADLNKSLTYTTDLRDLLQRAAFKIGDTLKSEQAFFFINTFDDHYVTAGTAGHKQLPRKDAIMLDGFSKTHNGVIVSALLEANDPIHRMMLSHRVELILPLKQANRSLGYLCLGYHRNSGYTYRDMKVLSTISDELVIAIQNALSVQEVKDLNENLQQRIDAATKELRASNAQLQRLDKAKDEFVSMASHQLRTPLTSIKGYVSMILDGDVGEINDTMRHMLDEAFMSSERMVHLINDFLSMSRIQTGKFMIEKVPIDLSKVVKQEIDSLQPSAIAHGLSFSYTQPANFPLINIDEGKIRQVIMNFADNAIYYSKSGTKINIILESNKDSIKFAVKDHGIGVPVSEQANLFSKFYRASNARTQRPDGTGVGLYLAKRIVDSHKGKIVFESTEGQGSTFGFTIPIKQD